MAYAPQTKPRGIDEAWDSIEQLLYDNKDPNASVRAKPSSPTPHSNSLFDLMGPPPPTPDEEVATTTIPKNGTNTTTTNSNNNFMDEFEKQKNNLEKKFEEVRANNVSNGNKPSRVNKDNPSEQSFDEIIDLATAERRAVAKVRAKFDYVTSAPKSHSEDDPNELNFHKGDIIYVLDKNDESGDGWWYGISTISGETGYFPFEGWVEEIPLNRTPSNANAHSRTPASSSKSNNSNTTGTTTASVGVAPLGLANVKAMESKGASEKGSRESTENTSSDNTEGSPATTPTSKQTSTIEHTSTSSSSSTSLSNGSNKRNSGSATANSTIHPNSDSSTFNGSSSNKNRPSILNRLRNTRPAHNAPHVPKEDGASKGGSPSVNPDVRATEKGIKYQPVEGTFHKTSGYDNDSEAPAELQLARAYEIDEHSGNVTKSAESSSSTSSIPSVTTPSSSSASSPPSSSSSGTTPSSSTTTERTGGGGSSAGTKKTVSSPPSNPISVTLIGSTSPRGSPKPASSPSSTSEHTTPKDVRTPRGSAATASADPKGKKDPSNPKSESTKSSGLFGSGKKKASAATPKSDSKRGASKAASAAKPAKPSKSKSKSSVGGVPIDTSILLNALNDPSLAVGDPENFRYHGGYDSHRDADASAQIQKFVQSSEAETSPTDSAGSSSAYTSPASASSSTPSTPTTTGVSPAQGGVGSADGGSGWRISIRNMSLKRGKGKDGSSSSLLSNNASPSINSSSSTPSMSSSTSASTSSSIGAMPSFNLPAHATNKNVELYIPSSQPIITASDEDSSSASPRNLSNPPVAPSSNTSTRSSLEEDTTGMERTPVMDEGATQQGEENMNEHSGEQHGSPVEYIPYSQLSKNQALWASKNLNRMKLEDYLTDSEFNTVFGMSRATWRQLPRAQQNVQKRQKGLW